MRGKDGLSRWFSTATTQVDSRIGHFFSDERKNAPMAPDSCKSPTPTVFFNKIVNEIESSSAEILGAKPNFRSRVISHDLLAIAVVSICEEIGQIIDQEIGSRVGRKQTTVMRICNRWMQEGTTDRRVRSHPPQCTTSRADRQIVLSHRSHHEP
ncbi:hypothetical protein LAZ67_13000230 [Cordylochernes scorpioides]|uniref:Uncharacterized protein n=1 Tax=Cordylochernes scorpioides TaxID=51811 RepID=A0ABY6L687_9ARAC|nr:hypothetical protein LAZ67_13000230 [Cordylochernes scorpioides]